MAPNVKRGKIRAQVLGDVYGDVRSFATKIGETLGLVRNLDGTAAAEANTTVPAAGDGDSGVGGSSTSATDNNDRR